MSKFWAVDECLMPILHCPWADARSRGSVSGRKHDTMRRSSPRPEAQDQKSCILKPEIGSSCREVGKLTDEPACLKVKEPHLRVKDWGFRIED